MKFNNKQKRCFQRMICGFRRHGKKRLRFITLTTGVNYEGNINKDFLKLRNRLVHLTVSSLLRQGYIKKREIKKFYGSKDIDKEFRFDYIKVNTQEGNKGVIHCLFYGQYIPQKWLSDAWNDITNGSYVVDIRQCRRRVYDAVNLGLYCVSQYVSGQTDYIKFNCSKNWCFKGFINTWYGIKKVFHWRYRKEIMNYVIDCVREGVNIDIEFVKRFPKRGEIMEN